MAHAGSWSIGGFALPDYKITENLASMLSGGRTTDLGNAFLVTPSPTTFIPPKKPNGNVLGATTSNITNTPNQPLQQTQNNPIQTAQSNVNSQQDALRSMIESGFGNLMGEYDRQASYLPGWEQEDLGQVSATAGNVRQGLQDSLTNAKKSIDMSKQQVQSGVDKSVSDIRNSLTSLLKNAQGMIGSVGAGSSSAAQQLVPYAFSKMYAQQRGNIQGQANNQFTELDKKGLDVENQFNTQKMQLDQWEGDQMTSIKDKYRNLLMSINNARAGATGQRAVALQGVQEGILTQARNELATIQQEAANQRQALFQSALAQQERLGTAQQQMASTANYTVNPLLYQQMQAMQGGGASVDGGWWNPLALLKKQQQI